MIRSLDKLKSLIKQIQNLNCDLQEYTVLLELEKPVQSVLSLYEQVDEKQEQLQNLDDLITDISNCNTAISEHSTLLEMSPAVNSLLELYQRKDVLVKEQEGISSIIETIQIKDSRISRAKLVQKEKQQEFDINFPDICPLCGEEHKTEEHGNK